MRWTITMGSGLGMLVVAYVLFSATFAREEEEILLTEVPAHVLAAVQNARQDITLKSAERIYEDSEMYYEIEGDYEGKELEFLVSPSGKILGIEEE